MFNGAFKRPLKASFQENRLLQFFLSRPANFRVTLQPETLFYLDPPYWGCEDDYGKAMFDRADFARMAELLVRIRGRFILSLNDLPEVRQTFAAFNLAEVRTTYTIERRRNGAAAGRAELLISN